MKTIGTALEWFNTKPESYIRHPHMQKGLCVRILEYSKKGIKSTYPASYGDGPPMLPHANRGCPYIVEGFVNFIAYAIYGLEGFSCVIPINYALDQQWYEVDPIKCYEEEQ